MAHASHIHYDQVRRKLKQAMRDAERRSRACSSTPPTGANGRGPEAPPRFRLSNHVDDVSQTVIGDSPAAEKNVWSRTDGASTVESPRKMTSTNDDPSLTTRTCARSRHPA